MITYLSQDDGATLLMDFASAFHTDYYFEFAWGRPDFAFPSSDNHSAVDLACVAVAVFVVVAVFDILILVVLRLLFENLFLHLIELVV